MANTLKTPPTAQQWVDQFDWENSTLDIPMAFGDFAKEHLESFVKFHNGNDLPIKENLQTYIITFLQ